MNKLEREIDLGEVIDQRERRRVPRYPVDPVPMERISLCGFPVGDQDYCNLPAGHGQGTPCRYETDDNTPLEDEARAALGAAFDRMHEQEIPVTDARPSHYRLAGLECVDVERAIYPPEQFAVHAHISALEYLWRLRAKDPTPEEVLKTLRKAATWIGWAIDAQERVVAGRTWEDDE